MRATKAQRNYAIQMFNYYSRNYKGVGQWLQLVALLHVALRDKRLWNLLCVTYIVDQVKDQQLLENI